MSMFQGFQQLM